VAFLTNSITCLISATSWDKPQPESGWLKISAYVIGRDWSLWYRTRLWRLKTYALVNSVSFLRLDIPTSCLSHFTVVHNTWKRWIAVNRYNEIYFADHMSTQYRLVQSGKTASGGCSAGQGSSEPVAPRIYEDNVKTNVRDLRCLRL
jgi:hypothetical protein